MGYGDTAVYDRQLEGELTITITLAEYRELVRVSTLYEQEHERDKRPLSYESIGEAE